MTSDVKRVPVLRKDLMRDNPRGHLWPVDSAGYVLAQSTPQTLWERFVAFMAGDLPDWVVVCQRCGYQEDRYFVVARSHRTCPDAPRVPKPMRCIADDDDG